MTETYDAVVCGAGIAGISAAYHLCVTQGVGKVLLVDERPPLSLTSDKSTECYRNWWPGPGDGMVALMNRSIDLLEDLAEQTGNAINLNRRGYLFVTADPARADELAAQAEEAAALGAGEVRYHRGRPGDPPYQPAPPDGYRDQPTGADVITDRKLIRTHFPYLSEEVVAVVHPRRCGWFSAQQLGMLMLERAQTSGVSLVQSSLEAVEVRDGRVEAVRLGNGEAPARVLTQNLVNAAGPHLKRVGRMLGVELPVHSELHGKVAFRDRLGLFPREAPLLIWTDPQHLPWDEAEKMQLEAEPEAEFLLSEFPEGVHARSEGRDDSPIVLMLWTYHLEPVEPAFPPAFDPHLAEITLRGLSTMLPALKAYLDRLPRPVVDGGYYTKTAENRPLVGPLPVEGAWVLGALSGFGLMASPACGDLLAAHVAGAPLPQHAKWFLPARYEDPAYLELLANWGRSGQI
jgi:glycine/D-amino acid oxidase-like deaminating enzyme